MTTSPRISFGLYALEIKAGSSPSAENLQSFSKVNDLVTDNVVPYPYITYEPDFWLLDGKFHFLPENEDVIHIGLMSSLMSGEAGAFETPPVLTINFDQTYSSDGLILRFSQYTEDYAASIRVIWYALNGTVLRDTMYSPDSWEYEIDVDVQNFARIEITFYSTNKANRYLRLSGIDFGQLIYFTGSEIKQANILEEIDMLSVTVPVNTLDLTLYSSSTDFSIVNPKGYYSRLTQRQPLSAYERVNSLYVFMGRYYLDTWQNNSETEIVFKCIDAIGVMDRIQFFGGVWQYSGIASQDIIAAIMNAAQLPYSLDTELYDIPVMGYLPVCSCREALQQVAFAIGAYIDTSRSNLVKIYKSIIAINETDTISVAGTEKLQDSTVNLDTLVTGVEITSHYYTPGTDEVKIYNGTLAVGTYLITFNEPAHDLLVTNAKIVDSGDNWVKVLVNTEDEVTITGLSYIDNQQVCSKYANVGSYVTKNVLQIKDATLVTQYNAGDVLDRVYAYYQQRYIINTKLIAPAIELGQTVSVDTFDGKKIKGCVEKLSADLANGFIASVNVTGVVDGVE